MALPFAVLCLAVAPLGYIPVAFVIVCGLMGLYESGAFRK